MIRLLAVCGSLRAASTNKALLETRLKVLEAQVQNALAASGAKR